MQSLDRRKGLIRGNAARRGDLQGGSGGRDLLMQPALDRGVALLQGSQAGADHLAAGGIGAGGDQAIDIARLLAR